MLFVADLLSHDSETTITSVSSVGPNSYHIHFCEKTPDITFMTRPVLFLKSDGFDNSRIESGPGLGCMFPNINNESKNNTFQLLRRQGQGVCFSVFMEQVGLLSITLSYKTLKV